MPSPAPSSTDTVFDPLFATARSMAPSALKSPTARADGLVPVTESVFELNVPSPAPRNTETVFEPELAVTRSIRLS